MDAASNSNEAGAVRWSLRLFGGFALATFPGGEQIAVPGRRERVLLAYLALSPHCRVSRRKLAALLWGDAADETALDNLRVCIWSLRKTLGDGQHRSLASDGKDVVLDARAFAVDVLAFRRLIAQSGTAALEEAALLYTGPFLDGVEVESEEFQSWRREEAMRCKDLALDAGSRLMPLLAESGNPERAIAEGMRLLGLEPLHEANVRQLMRLYNWIGRRATAVELYRNLEEGLRKEFGAEPEPATRAVFAEITLACDTARFPLAAETAIAHAAAARNQTGEQEQGAPGPTVPAQPRWRFRARTAAGGLAAVLIAIAPAYLFLPPLRRRCP
jgi:DNA-binding SARP family transcriptional activator